MATKNYQLTLYVADQFLKALTTIPSLNFTLGTSYLMCDLPVKIKEIRPDVLLIKKAMEEIQQNDSFKTILEFILLIVTPLTTERHGYHNYYQTNCS